MRVYISGPLQGSKDLAAARRFYDELAETVRACGHDAYVPHHYTDPQDAASMTAASVFTKDMHALDDCDAVIAHIGQPSTGVGAELALAIASGRSVLGLKRTTEPSSRFAEGLISEGGGTVEVFAEHEDLVPAITRWLSSAEHAHTSIEPPALRHRHHLPATRGAA